MNRKLLCVAALGVALIFFASFQTGLAWQPASPSAPAIALGEPGTSYRYLQTFGSPGEPYIADTVHLNRPQGLFIDLSDNLFVTEQVGHRLLAYDSQRNTILALGQAGICASESNGFCNAIDVAVDKDGNIWAVDSHRVVEYSPTGGFVQQFPSFSDNVPGADNQHFNNTTGVAVSPDRQLFVADEQNQRIQVFDFSGGALVYSTTIGVTGVISSTPGYFNHPAKIALDGQNRLLVADRDNDRLQRCTYDQGWSCAVLDDTLSQPQSVAVDRSGNIYITDHWRIRKCTPAGVCSDFATGTKGYVDLAVDSAGSVYASAPWEDIIEQYNPSGELQGTYLGEKFVPYLTDSSHFFHARLAVDASGNLLIIEENGQRLIKLAPDGSLLWTFGVPGVDQDDDSHLVYPHAVAVDQAGNAYVANNCQVKIITASGTYSDTLGTGCGNGDYQFGWVGGVEVDKNGNIYVADYPNHRVQIYNSRHEFIGRLGATGVCSPANDRLCSPIAVAVDDQGGIYVTDGGNLRLQKFNSSYAWQMTIGDGTSGETFGQLNWPENVAVDAQGRIFVSDWNNNRVQVFDAHGAYLTTIGGLYGAGPNQMKSAAGVAVDGQGNVYIADWDNFRILKFALGVPDWQQTNINGFGERWSSGVTSLESFNGQLYAASSSWNTGAQVWRSSDGRHWTAASQISFGSAHQGLNPAITDLLVFNNQLYASTGWGSGSGQLWRSPDGSTWTQVIGEGLSPNNNAILRLGVFDNRLYAATGNNITGSEIWRSSSGDPGSWEKVVSGGLGNANNILITTFAIFNGNLYAAGENPSDGAEVWRTSDGLDWAQVNANGFGKAANMQIGSLVVFDNMLYAGTYNEDAGAEIWCSTGGADWTQFASGGFGDRRNIKIESLYAFNGSLYAVTHNRSTGAEVWRLAENEAFEQVNIDGFGDNHNYATLWDTATLAYQGQLYLGFWNDANGGELWRYGTQYQVYLPLTKR